MKDVERKPEISDSGAGKRYHVPEELDYTSATSSCDCTGLIPQGRMREEVLNDYHEIYPFGSPEI